MCFISQVEGVSQTFQFGVILLDVIQLCDLCCRVIEKIGTLRYGHKLVRVVGCCIKQAKGTWCYIKLPCRIFSRSTESGRNSRL